MFELEEWCSSAGRRVAGRELRDLLRGGGASPPSSDSLLEARLMHVPLRFSHDYCSPSRSKRQRLMAGGSGPGFRRAYKATIASEQTKRVSW